MPTDFSKIAFLPLVLNGNRDKLIHEEWLAKLFEVAAHSDSFGKDVVKLLYQHDIPIMLVQKHPVQASVRRDIINNTLDCLILYPNFFLNLAGNALNLIHVFAQTVFPHEGKHIKQYMQGDFNFMGVPEDLTETEFVQRGILLEEEATYMEFLAALQRDLIGYKPNLKSERAIAALATVLDDTKMKSYLYAKHKNIA